MITKSRLTAISASALLVQCAGADPIGFSPGVNYTTPTRPEGVVAGDFNLDGYVDLAVTTDTLDKVSILLNNGDGTFAAPINYLLPNGSGPGAIVAVDLNGDQRLDLAVALQNTGAVQILINNGSGAFALGSSFPVGANPRGLIATHLNGDQFIDLAVANRDSGTASVLLGNGAGGFAVASYTVGSGPRAVAAADITGDGRPELFVTNHDTRNISILTNNGAGAFTPGATLSVGANLRPEGIVAADLDGDTDFDLAVSTSGNGLNFASVFTNANGLFSGPFNYAVGGVDPGAIAAADLDMNGSLDLVTANQTSGDISALPNNGSGTFGAPLVVATGAHPDQLALADFDRDGVPDVAVTNRDSNTTTVLINTAPSPCYANCDNSTIPPVLNVNDFICFLNRFAAGSAYANCDGSTIPPVLNVNDFGCFLNRFAAGCP